MIKLAHTADTAIIPFYVYADRARYFNNWNNFFLPKPFARVIISFGEMIKFTPVEDLDTFKSQRLYLEMIMRPELRINPD